MIIYNATTQKEENLTLCKWHGGWNAGWETECMDDLADGYIYRFRRDDEGRFMMSEEDISRESAWWERECADANNGTDGDILPALTEDEIERGDEWVFERSAD